MELMRRAWNEKSWELDMVQVPQTQLSQHEECSFYLKCNGKLLEVISGETL